MTEDEAQRRLAHQVIIHAVRHRWTFYEAVNSEAGIVSIKLLVKFRAGKGRKQIKQ